MSKYRKKPVVIEAEHFTDENKERCFFSSSSATLSLELTRLVALV